MEHLGQLRPIEPREFEAALLEVEHHGWLKAQVQLAVVQYCQYFRKKSGHHPLSFPQPLHFPIALIKF